MSQVMKWAIVLLLVVAVIVGAFLILSPPGEEQGWSTISQLRVRSRASETDPALLVDQQGTGDILNLRVDNGELLTVGNDGGLTQGLGVENVGGFPTISSAAITFASTGALWTIADGEVWLVHDLLCDVSANFNCTGDDCTVTIGDGSDANGLLDLVDAELQAAYTAYTGAAAGWVGNATTTQGVYLNEVTTNGDVGHIYAPSGAAETIDIAVGGTTPVAGTGTCYLMYTRLQ